MTKALLLALVAGLALACASSSGSDGAPTTSDADGAPRLMHEKARVDEIEDSADDDADLADVIADQEERSKKPNDEPSD